MHANFSDRFTLEKNAEYISALSKLGRPVSRDISLTFATEISRNSTYIENNFGNNRKNLEWALEVMSYALILPLNEIHAIKTCVDYYAKWIHNYCLSENTDSFLLYEGYNHYFPLILSQLKNLFIPRFEPNIQEHSQLCCNILSSLRFMVSNKTPNHEHCDEIYLFLLTILYTVFSQQPRPEIRNLSDYLGNILSGDFFFIWIKLCSYSFPTMSIWRSFDDVCSHCIHNQYFVSQWASVTLTLTKRVITQYFLNGDSNSRFSGESQLLDDVSTSLGADSLIHVWLKVFYSVGNLSQLGEPVELCMYIWPDMIATELALMSQGDEVQELPTRKYSEHFLKIQKCLLSILPDSFFLFLRFVSAFVFLMIPDLKKTKINFLEIYKDVKMKATLKVSSMKHKSSTQFFSSSSEKPQLSIDFEDQFRGIFAHIDKEESSYESNEDMPFSILYTNSDDSHYIECNTIMNLLSEWIIGSCISFKDASVTENFDYIIKMNSDLSLPTSPDPTFKFNLRDHFEIGRAYAYNILLRLITHYPYNSTLSPMYVSRAYVLIMLGLMYHQHKAGIVFISIILSSVDLFFCQLRMVEILIPHYLRAINSILMSDSVDYCSSIKDVSIRNAALRIMISIISQAFCAFKSAKSVAASLFQVPLQYDTVCSYIINTLCNSIEKETDSANIQLYLSAMSLILYNLTDELHRSPYAHIGTPQEVSSDSSNDKLGEHFKMVHKITTLFLSNSSEHVLFTLSSTSNSKTFDLSLVLSLVSFLSALSIIPVDNVDHKEVVITIKCLCSFIENLALRPPIYHNRDLHSLIVAAYNCLLAWINNHKWTMFNTICTENILQVVELGLTGMKTHTHSNSTKEAKEQKPISYRVYDIAEYLMLVIFQLFSSYNSNDNLIFSTINETEFPKLKPVYYIIENVGIMSCMDIYSQGKGPKCMVLLRSVMGKHLYEFEFKSTLSSTPPPSCLIDPGLLMFDQVAEETFKLRMHNDYPVLSPIWKSCNADSSFPTINSIEKQYKIDMDTLRKQHEISIIDQKKCIDEYITTLKTSTQQAIQKVYPDRFTGAYHAARMFLSSLRYLNFQVLEPNAPKPQNRFYKINEDDEFISQIFALDKIPIRNTDFAYLFLVNNFNKSLDEILSHQNTMYPNLFNNFISQLGTETIVKSHPGYLGPFRKDDLPDTSFIYYSDLINELVIIPSYSITHTVNKLPPVSATEVSLFASPTSNQSASTTNVNDGSSVRSASARESRVHKGGNIGVVVVWVEDSSSSCCFPIKDMVERMNQALDCKDFLPHAMIAIYPLNNEFAKIRVYNPVFLKPIEVPPICDGIIVQTSYLGEFIKDSILSLNLKRRLEIDSFCSPHIKRKNFIQNLSKKYLKDINSSEYYCGLLEQEFLSQHIKVV